VHADCNPHQLAALRASGNERLVMVADLTCDVRGAVEALARTSTVDEPFFVYDPATKVRTSECFGSLMTFVDL
jgi:alpha-aminoadipic semialdehyde synthase